MHDPIYILLGIGWGATLILSGALALHRRWCSRQKAFADLQGRVSNLESALKSARAELVQHRAALDPAVRRLGPPPLDPNPIPFWARAATKCAPEYHAPVSVYPIQPWEFPR